MTSLKVLLSLIAVVSVSSVKGQGVCNTNNLDIILVVDSGQNSVNTFSSVRTGITSYLTSLRGLGGNIQVAVIPYATTVGNVLARTGDMAQLIVNVGNINPSNLFSTQHSAGLEYLVQNPGVFRNTANKLVIVISPSPAGSNDRNRILAAASTLRVQGVQLYLQAYGSNHDKAFWEGVTAMSTKRSVFTGDLTSLSSRLLEITTLYCDVCADCQYTQNGIGFTAYPSACDQFYQCVLAGGKVVPHLMTCAAGTFWNGVTNRCDYMQNVVTSPLGGCRYSCVSAQSTSRYPSALSCNSYYQCNATKIETKCCGYGESFNSASGTCVANSKCKDFCLDNACSSGTATASYQSRLGCSSYYQCNGYTRVNKCCSPGQRFDPGTAQCVNDASCTDPCNVAGCLLKAVANDECSYTATEHGKDRLMKCAAGTSFVLAECGCTKLNNACPKPETPTPGNLCPQELEISFTTSLQKTGAYWISPRGVTVSRVNNAQVGVFGGQSSIRIPYLRDNDFSYSRIFRIRYTETSNTGAEMLFGNPCCSPNIREPSLVVTHRPNTRTVSIGARTRTGTLVYTRVNYDGQYDATFWKEIVFAYSGSTITGQLRIYQTNNPNRLTKVDFPALNVGGRIARLETDMTVGLGTTSQQTGFSAFTGVIQRLNIFFCKLRAVNLDNY